MEEPTARKLRFLTLQIVGAVAIVHLVVGTAELGRIADAGLLGEYVRGGEALAQPEPLLFTLSALAILAGLLAVGLGHLGYRRAYLFGIGVMGLYIVGWVAWHTVFDHGLAGLTGGASDEGSHSHAGLYTVFVSHYLQPLFNVSTGVSQPGQVTLAVVSKTLEAIALALLTTLYALDPRVENPTNPVSSLVSERTDER